MRIFELYYVIAMYFNFLPWCIPVSFILVRYIYNVV